jgi:hypothetical protein
VMDYRHPVGGDMDVQFHSRGAEGNGAEKACQGVLHAVPRCPPVTDALDLRMTRHGIY